MSHISNVSAKKVTAITIRSRKGGAPILAMTAYDYPSARLVDEAGFELILVGDSLAQTVLGYDSTLPVTIDEMIIATRAVRRGVHRGLLVADMPFGSYQDRTDKAVKSAIKFVKEAGAEAVKVEGGSRRSQLIKAIVEAEIPVMGHIGLTPQSMLRMGGYRVQGKSLEAARELIEDAIAVERAGAFALVLEGIPAEISPLITDRLSIPTIGIGAGRGCDGQILVLNDLLGLTFGHRAKFVREYADLKTVISDSLKRFANDVTAHRFPSDEESYHLPEGTVIDIEDSQSESMPPLGPIN